MICFDQCNVSGSDVLLSDGIFNFCVRYCADCGSICGHEASASLCPRAADKQSPLLISSGSVAWVRNKQWLNFISKIVITAYVAYVAQNRNYQKMVTIVTTLFKAL